MYSFFLIAFTTLLTTVNPVAALGPFITLTDGQSKEAKKRIVRRATLVSGLILVISAAVGSLVFRLFGISLPAFRIAGGILLFSVGVDMLNARYSRTKVTDEERKEANREEDIAIFPLATPLITGPGAVASSLILSESAKSIPGLLALYASIVLTQVCLYIVLIQSDRLIKYIGPIPLKVLTRMMGLILAALATQFVLDGLSEALPGLLFRG